jgi:signal transduction histidine kinase
MQIKKIHKTALFILITVLASCINTVNNDVKKPNSITRMLDNAEIMLQNNPTFAYETANKALNLAIAQNNTELISRALILKGRYNTFIGNNDSAKTLFISAYKLASEHNLAAIQATAVFEEAKIYYSRGDYNLALEKFIALLNWARVNNLTTLETEIIYYIGKYYHTTGQFAQSTELYHEALSRHPHPPALHALLLMSIGKTLLNEGNTAPAVEYYQQAYEIAQATTDLLLQADAYNHLGSAYDVLGQFELSITYHQKALALRTQMNHPADMAKSYNNLGEAYLKSNQPDSALINLSKSLETSIKSEYKKGTVKAITNMGRLPNKWMNKEIEYNLQTALELSQNAGYDAGIANSNLQIAQQLYQREEYNKSLEHYNMALEKAQNARLSELYPEIHYGLHLCFLKLNKLKKAIWHLNEYAELEKTRMENLNQRQLSELFILFESEKKEKQNQMLIAENATKEMALKRKNIMILIFITSLVSLSVIIWMIYKQLNQKHKAIAIQQLLNKELEKANRDKDKLMSIIAHELRNPLYWFQNLTQSLSSRFKEMPPEKVEKSLMALDESAKNTFHLMDNLLFWSRSRLNRISVKKETINIKELAESATQIFSSIINQKQISLHININQEYIINTDVNLISCVIRNLVSNAIKFTPQKGFIKIDATQKENSTEISVTDSGIGITNQQKNDLLNNINFSGNGFLNEKGTGFGLKLCNEFVNMCGGHFQIDHNYQNGARFIVVFPME